jgi:hypothetical protein
MRAAGNPRLRFAINREIVALAFEMKAAGASRQHIMTIGHRSLQAARHEMLRCRPRLADRRG